MAAHMSGKRSVSSEPENDSSEREAKKSKLEENLGEDENILHNFNGFQVEKVLYEKPQHKALFLLGSFGVEQKADKAVVLLEKKPFHSDEVALQSLLSKRTTLQLCLKNDIYSVYEGFPPAEVNGVKTTIIYPATEKHIRKYQEQALYLMTESYEDYKTITLPYLNEQQLSIQWVYNILDKKSEAEKIIFEDADPELGFVLLPDMKWDGQDTKSLNLIAICHKRGLKSLRDLNKDHLPLLKNLKDKCLEAIKTKYNVDTEHIRMYLHYQPSNYHLHVHVTHLKNVTPGTEPEKAHLLTDVIENIELMEDYYQRRSLTFALRESDGLLDRFRKAGK